MFNSTGLGGKLGLGAGEPSLSEWSEEEDGNASEPLLDQDQDSTGYTTDDPALDQASMMNDTGLTDAEGMFCLFHRAVFSLLLLL